jgi:hypothetical protein
MYYLCLVLCSLFHNLHQPLDPRNVRKYVYVVRITKHYAENVTAQCHFAGILLVELDTWISSRGRRRWWELGVIGKLFDIDKAVAEANEREANGNESHSKCTGDPTRWALVPSAVCNVSLLQVSLYCCTVSRSCTGTGRIATDCKTGNTTIA